MIVPVYQDVFLYTNEKSQKMRMIGGGIDTLVVEFVVLQFLYLFPLKLKFNSLCELFDVVGLGKLFYARVVNLLAPKKKRII